MSSKTDKDAVLEERCGHGLELCFLLGIRVFASQYLA